jgi:UDP-glucose 4-epimerase
MKILITGGAGFIGAHSGRMLLARGHEVHAVDDAVYGEQEQFPCNESHPRRPASPYGASKLCGEEYLLPWSRLHGLSTLALRYANVYGPGQDPMANVLGLEGQVSGALNVGTGRETNVVEISRGLAQALGLSQQPKHGPPAPGEQRRSVVDPAAIGKALGWQPTVQIVDGLARTAQWFAK